MSVSNESKRADRGALRRLWFQVHLWIGIALFLVLIPVCVSGSLLVWHDALDRLAAPQRYDVTGPVSRPLSDYAAAARAVLRPDEPIAQIRLPEHDGDPVVVSAPMSFEGKERPRGRPPQHMVWIDPATASVLDEGSSAQGLTRFMHVLHGTLFIPEIGRKVVGWIGWLMLVSCLTGIWLWWPRNGRFLKGFSWRRSPLFTGNLHHQVGIWIALPLAVLSFTGAYISFPQTMRKAVTPFTGAAAEQPAREGRGERAAEGAGRKKGEAPRGGGRPQRPQPLATTAMTPDQALNAAAAVKPAGELELASVSWPNVRKAEWTIAWRRDGKTVEATVDDAAGAVSLKPEPAPDKAGAFARLMRRVHDGVGLGIVWQTIIFIGGIAPAVLGITGLIMWLKLRGGRRRVEALRRGSAA